MLLQRTLLSFLILFSSMTHSELRNILPKHFVISYFEHESIGPFIQLIQNTYQDLNISTEFVPLPLSRGYNELNDGTVDADVGRIKDVAKGFSNILIIEPPLYLAELVLLCKKGLPCGKRVLMDPSKTVLSNIGNQRALEKSKIEANIQTIENMSVTVDMLRLGRVNYVIYGSTRQLRNTLESEFDVSLIQQIPIHHVINKKHRDIKTQFEAALIKRLRQFNPDSAVEAESN